MVLLLEITMINILHSVDHLHHNDKRTDDDVFPFKAERTVKDTKEHHKGTGDHTGYFILGK